MKFIDVTYKGQKPVLHAGYSTKSGHTGTLMFANGETVRINDEQWAAFKKTKHYLAESGMFAANVVPNPGEQPTKPEPQPTVQEPESTDDEGEPQPTEE